tara:strand:- start:2795 stop:3340 length:546 start_codon:yes stop_codon:yes gene_type:complete
MRNPKELFESIVNLSKKALGEDTIKEEVVLSEEVVLEDEVKEVETKEVVKEETPVDEAPVIAPVEQPAAVSKSEFDSAIAEIKEMYAKVLESISPSQPLEVPEALSEVVATEEEVLETEEVVLSEEVIEETIEEVQLQEESANDDLIHDPEAIVEKKVSHLYSQNRVKTTEDYVFQSLFNK